jgi:uncharacterized membrane-anchored protein YhcB (DUF1043 family)
VNVTRQTRTPLPSSLFSDASLRPSLFATTPLPVGHFTLSPGFPLLAENCTPCRQGFAFHLATASLPDQTAVHCTMAGQDELRAYEAYLQSYQQSEENHYARSSQLIDVFQDLVQKYKKACDEVDHYKEACAAFLQKSAHAQEQIRWLQSTYVSAPTPIE